MLSVRQQGGLDQEIQRQESENNYLGWENMVGSGENDTLVVHLFREREVFRGV